MVGTSGDFESKSKLNDEYREGDSIQVPLPAVFGFEGDFAVADAVTLALSSVVKGDDVLGRENLRLGLGSGLVEAERRRSWRLMLSPN